MTRIRNTLILASVVQRDKDNARDWIAGICAGAAVLGIWMVSSAILGG